METHDEPSREARGLESEHQRSAQGSETSRHTDAGTQAAADPGGTLSPRSIDALQAIIRVNLDTARGFRDAAEQVSSPSLGYLFENVARVREKHAAELQHHVRSNQIDPAQTGSVLGTLQRWWLDLRAWISDGDPYAILAVMERSEDQIKATYEELLREVVGEPLRGVLHRQFAEILATHDQMHQLRDQWAAKKGK